MSIRRLCLIASLALPSPGCAEMGSWLSPELRRLTAEKIAIEERLAFLPPAPPIQMTQRLGWHSLYSHSAGTVEWMDLALDRAERIDTVVLIAPPPGGGTTTEGYGFPIRFRVEFLGADEDAEHVIVADYTKEDFPNPGLLPVVIETRGAEAKKVRVTATRLFRSGERSLFALGEVMLLQGDRNLGPRLEALGPHSVKGSSSQGTRPDWGRVNLVDGHTALGPPLGTKPSPTLGYRSKARSESLAPPDPWVEVDLGNPMPVAEVRLFPAHPVEFAHSPGYGFPLRYEIEMREEENSPPHVVSSPEAGLYTAPPGANVVTLDTGGHRARFVRLKVLEPHVSNGSVVFALAEMQIWSGDANLAFGKRVEASPSEEADGWSRAALVDGFASQAEILGWRDWLGGLSARREALHALTRIKSRVVEVKSGIRNIAIWSGSGILATGALILLLFSRHQRRTRLHELESLRQRIARDLHDEIGSSLGSISLIAQDLLAAPADSPESRADLTEIKQIADETVGAMRDITRLIQSDRYGDDDLPTLLRDTAARMLRNLPHTVETPATKSPHPLPVDAGRDLILIFKEALHNVLRHASTASVVIRLLHKSDGLVLVVSDNGPGFDPGAPTDGMGVANMRRRAAKHGGSIVIDSTPEGGTLLTLHLPYHG